MGVSDLNLDSLRLTELCQRYGVLKLEAFGSFAGGNADSDSDLDLLVTFEATRKVGLEFVSLQQDLQALVRRPVDLLTRASVEKSPNKYFRRFALRHTELVYERA